MIRRRPESPPSAPAATRLVEALARELDTFYRLAYFLVDEEMAADEAVAWLASLAVHVRHDVAPGRERAWLLAALLRLVEAHAGEPGGKDGQLPRLAESSPMPVRHLGIAGDDVEEIDEMLRGLDKRTRASVLLVVHEGLTIDDAARVQGGSRRAFTRRHVTGLAMLPEECIDLLMGRRSSAPDV